MLPQVVRNIQLVKSGDDKVTEIAGTMSGSDEEATGPQGVYQEMAPY